jgi:spore coat protein U-like protein
MAGLFVECSIHTKEAKMKRLIVTAVAAALLAWPFAGALAAGNNTLTVSANVLGTCVFNSATSTLAFGALDPTSAADATASGSTTFWCTSGVAFALADDDGLYETGPDANRMKHVTAAQYIPYSVAFSTSAAVGGGAGSPITLTIDGTILNADYVGAQAGDYSDTVVITVTP